MAVVSTFMCRPWSFLLPFPAPPIRTVLFGIDFASKVVCQRALLSPVGSVKRFKMQRILRSPLATRTPLETQSQGGVLWIPRHSLSNGTHTEKLCSPMSDHFLYLVAFIADYSFIFFFMKSRTLLKHHFFPVANITPAMAVAITAPAMP